MTATYEAFNFSIRACLTETYGPVFQVLVHASQASLPVFARPLPLPFREIHDEATSGDADRVPDDGTAVRARRRKSRDDSHQDREHHQEDSHPRILSARNRDSPAPDRARLPRSPDVPLSRCQEVAEVFFRLSPILNQILNLSVPFTGACLVTAPLLMFAAARRIWSRAHFAAFSFSTTNEAAR